MELGNKIKKLRLRAGLTQETLAEELGVSFQTISKWENEVCAPDISMLPKLSVYFGVTIDELFDLTTEQRLHRIENMLDMEQELPHGTFVEVIDFLHEQLEGAVDKARIYNFLAHTYHHRMMSDKEKVSRFTKQAIHLRPNIENCGWMLQTTDKAVSGDWNTKNHHKIINFYKEIIEECPEVAKYYLALIDNLLADNRILEAKTYLECYKKIDASKDVIIYVYESRIALAEHDMKAAARYICNLEEKHSNDATACFELGNHYATQCEYDKAIYYYKRAFDLDNRQNKRLSVGALEAVATLHELQGNNKKAVATYDEILQVLDEVYNFREGEPVREIIEEKQSLLNKMNQ